MDSLESERPEKLHKRPVGGAMSFISQFGCSKVSECLNSALVRPLMEISVVNWDRLVVFQVELQGALTVLVLS